MKTLDHLERLDLSHNRLTKVDPHAFSPNFAHLNLSDNPIRSFTRSWRRRKLTKTEASGHLDVSTTKLSRIGADDFSRVRGMDIDFRYAPLRDLTPDLLPLKSKVHVNRAQISPQWDDGAAKRRMIELKRLY